ncbi:MAG: pseudouridine synthase [Lachnospiraceae bacterium]|nr:pseudouridine synthase [Lachnospiraceae bacterium]
MIRLDKYLADMGVGTRSQVKQFIKKGQIQINGEIQKRPETKLDIAKDKVSFQGEEISYQEYVYYILHKPAGYVSAVKDNLYPTVLSLIDNPQGFQLFPVGRLDLDTEGLLLITNDGTLAHELLSPKKHVEKTYYARIDGKITEEDQRRFAAGLDIGDEKDTLPAKLEILKSGEESEITVTITEGRYHQVKRMFEAVGKKVTYLKRLQMGSLKLEETLEPGTYRALTEEEIRLLKER